MVDYEETSGYVRPKRVYKWPISMTNDDDDDDDDDSNKYSGFHKIRGIS